VKSELPTELLVEIARANSSNFLVLPS
jgi:hypothetical protein